MIQKVFLSRHLVSQIWKSIAWRQDDIAGEGNELSNIAGRGKNNILAVRRKYIIQLRCCFCSETKKKGVVTFGVPNKVGELELWLVRNAEDQQGTVVNASNSSTLEG